MFKKILNLSDSGDKNLKKGIFAAVLTNLVLVIPFWIVMQCMNVIIAPLISDEPLNTDKLWILFGWSVATAILYFFVYKYEYDKTYTTAYSESESIRIEVAEHMRKLPLSFFNQKDLSELTSNIMADCASIEQTMSHVVPQMLANVITISITCILLAIYNWRMALALFCALPISYFVVFITMKIAKKFGERHVKTKLNVSGQVQEYLEGMKVVKAFGLSGEKSIKLESALLNMKNSAMLFEATTGVFITLATMFLQVGIGLVVVVGVNLLTTGTLEFVPFLTFMIISSKIFAPVIATMMLLPEFFYTLISTKRMQALRKEPVMQGDENITLVNYNIQFKNVKFGYNKEDVIKDMSFSIPQGGVTAFVGPSGSGKSTVSRLVARFWDIDAGEITIGGKNIKTVDPEKLMSYMSFVFQDVVLFNDTVINNIRIGKQNATDEEIYVAAKMAHCDEFIKSMPQGYNSLIGENGCTLSGGERQRISIARALLKNAPIILLDEATASLDPENETLIQAAISELVKGRTVIVIAHRLRTVKDADQIIVLENGNVVEVGKGDELIAKKGLFAKLYKIQQDSLGWSVSTK